jgi:hypothetical protein
VNSDLIIPYRAKSEMDLRLEDVNRVEAVLERHAERQTAAVKQAIREYNALYVDAGSISNLEKRREVERAVSQYIQILKRLEQLRSQSQMSGGRL